MDQMISHSAAGELATAFQELSTKFFAAYDAMLTTVAELNTAFDRVNDAKFSCKVQVNGAEDRVNMRRELKREAWRVLIDKLGIMHVMSIAEAEKLKEALCYGYQHHRRHDTDPVDSLPEVTADNMLAVLSGFVNQASSYVDENIRNVFDTLKPYRTDDKKTNVANRWKLSQKIITGYAVESRHRGGFRMKYGRGKGCRITAIKALEKIFYLLEGRGVPVDYKGELENSIESSNEGTGETTYFEWKAFKNGNLHLKIKKPALLAEFNARACGDSRSLPGDDSQPYEGVRGYEPPEIEPGVGGFDLFETPPDLASRLVNEADVYPGFLVLEPNTGGGRLVHAVKAVGATVLGFEAQAHLAVETGSLCQDFLKTKPSEWPAVDAVVMNPPFSRGQDIHHVQHAWQFLKPAGKLAALIGPMALKRNTAAHEQFANWVSQIGATVEELPAGTFSESGTEVGCLLLVATKR